MGPQSFNWNELSYAPGSAIQNNVNPGAIKNQVEKEELILRNTFVNAQMGAIVPYNPAGANQEVQSKVKWVDAA